MYRGYDFFTNFFDRFKGASTSSCTRNNVALMDFFFFFFFFFIDRVECQGFFVW